MEVRPEFKQTEVGVIPSDWEIATLDSVVLKFQNGYAFPSDGYVGSGVPIITMAQIGLSGLFQFDEESVNYWPSEKADELKDFVVSFGDIIIAMTDVTPQKNLIGRMTCVNKHGPFLLNQRVGLLKLDKQKIDSRFICALSNSSLWRSYSRGVATLGVQANIGTKELKSGKIPLPPIVEQRIIATALSDVDALLESLDRLIAKKRDLKKAAMQQLLTGQTRLPGFSGEWEVRRLKSVAEISTGINKPLSEMGSGVLYVTVQDLYDKESIRTERLSRIKVTQSEVETRRLVVGDIVFGKSSVKKDGIGYPSQFLGCDEPVIFSGFTYRTRARDGVADPTFLFYALREEKTRRWLVDNSQSSALTNINQTIADAIPVQLPPTVEEQVVIASVLMAMDNELAVLEEQRNKTATLKQGMMQELLTGRTRLV